MNVMKYYHETCATMILNMLGRSIIDQELKRVKPVCEICGTELIRISVIEGDCIICPNDMYNHITDWQIIHDYQNDNLPELRKGVV